MMSDGLKRWRYLVSCAAVALASSACSGEGADRSDDAESSDGAESSNRATPAETPYDFLREGSISYDDEPAIWASLPYRSISLERQGCFGTCPIYKVEFSRDSGTGSGRGRYEGQMYVDRTGSFEGVVDIWDYGRLCELFDSLGFLALDENYSASWTDDETVVVETSGTAGTHRVLDYGRQGPPELVALQLAIDAIAERIDWQASGSMSSAPAD